MKITQIECLIAGSPALNNIVYVRTHTDTGIHGVGEAYRVGPDLATPHWVAYFAEQLVGRNPLEIERAWAMMYQGARFPPGSSGMAAISGIEQSLWDIAGKARGVPCTSCSAARCVTASGRITALGANRLKNSLKTGEELVMDQGFTALKTGPLGPDWRTVTWEAALVEARARLGALREAVGPDVDIGLDAHAAIWELARVLELSDVLSEFRPFFMEEPLRMENRRAMAYLRQKMPFALATGECLYTKYELGELIRDGSADILQPDVCIVGGLLEMRKIAFNAEAHDLVIAPHNPLGPVATMVNSALRRGNTEFPDTGIQVAQRSGSSDRNGAAPPCRRLLPDPRGSRLRYRHNRRRDRSPSVCASLEARR